MTRNQKIIVLLLSSTMIFMYISYYIINEDNVDVTNFMGEAGQVNLAQWDDFASSVKLGGEWLYYNNQLLSELDRETVTIANIPEYKKKEVRDDYYRYGTYQLKVEGLKANYTYGIYSGSQVTAFNLYGNNILIFSNGTVGKSKETHVSQWKAISGSVVSDENGSIVFSMEISNYEYQDGLFWNSPIIGNPENIFLDHIKKIIVNILLIVSFTLIGIGVTVVYFWFKLEKNMLYFALFLFDMSLRLMVTSSRPIMYFMKGMSWNWLIRIEYLTGYLLLPIITVFILSLCKHKFEKIFQWVAGIYTIVMVFILLFTEHEFYSSMLNLYLWFTVVCLMILGWQVIDCFKCNRFHITIMALVFINTFVSIGNQLFGSMISYVPIAIFNGILGLTVIVGIQLAEKIRKNDMLAFGAMIDPLTGIYNRKYLGEVKVNFIEDNIDDNFYVLFMDLDGFKNVNDSYGHEEGDQVLQIIAQRLRGCLRASDILLRYGGDEFVLITSLESIEQASALSKRIVDRVGKKIVREDREHDLGISVGISCCKDLTRDAIETCIRNSDKAMYQAKKNGGRQFMYFDEKK